ncbi:MAG: SURF1 family cytochrome oxidase biogenesis protein [Rickettsiaceae bacterium]|nr:SURF1 family cytochrome oxidase biogenesis protein [Rickettsiaceae bacterium]
MKKNIIFIFFPILVITFGLGLWQVARYYEKLSFAQNILRQKSNIEDISNIPKQNIGLYSTYIIEGTLDISKVFWLYRRHPLAKGKDGAYFLTKITTSSKQEFPIILGWVDRVNFVKIIKELSANPKVYLNALILPSENKSYFIPNNNYKKNICFTMYMDEINKELKVHDEGGYFLAALRFQNQSSQVQESDSKIYPIYPEMMINIPNHHLEYASLWFCLGLITLIFVYIARPSKVNITGK